MKLHRRPERPTRLKASEVLHNEPAEDVSFKFKIDIDKILEENKAKFYEDMLRTGNRPLYYLQLVDFLSVLDPAEYERITSTDGHTFEYYKEQFDEQAMFTIPSAVRWLLPLFPESRAEISREVSGRKREVYRDLRSASLEGERLIHALASGLQIFFLNPGERTQLTELLTKRMKQLLSSADLPLPMGILEDCFIAIPDIRSTIRQVVVNHLPYFQRQIVDPVSAYQVARFLRILEADEVEIASDGRLLLTSTARMGKNQPLPERNLTA